MDLSRIVSSQSSFQSTEADPLKLLAEGSIISVEVAIDEKTGKLGIKFNGVFYTAELPKDAKLGELLKVIIKAQGEQILLKLLEGSDDRFEAEVHHHLLPQQSSILSKEEKRIIREMLLASRVSEQVDAPVSTPRLHQSDKTPQNVREIAPPLNQDVLVDAQEVARSNASIKSSLVPEKLVTQSKGESGMQTFPFVREMRSVESSRVDDQLTHIKAQLHEIITQPAHEMQGAMIAHVVKDLLQPLMQMVMRPSATTEDVFKVIRQIFTRQIEKSIPFVEEGGAPFEAFNNAQAQHSVRKEAASIEKNIIPKALIKKVLDESISRSEFREVVRHEKVILEPLRSALTQIQSATEVLQKLQTSSGYKGEGVYFLLPFFVQPKIRFAECFLSPNDSSEMDDREERRRRPRLLKMKFHLPEIGEVVVELLSHGSDVHMNLFVESEYARESILSSRDVLEKFFRDENINAKTIDVFVSGKKTVAPSVITQELNVELRA